MRCSCWCGDQTVWNECCYSISVIVKLWRWHDNSSGIEIGWITSDNCVARRRLYVRACTGYQQFILWDWKWIPCRLTPRRRDTSIQYVYTGVHTPSTISYSSTVTPIKKFALLNNFFFVFILKKKKIGIPPGHRVSVTTLIKLQFLMNLQFLYYLKLSVKRIHFKRFTMKNKCACLGIVSCINSREHRRLRTMNQPDHYMECQDRYVMFVHMWVYM